MPKSEDGQYELVLENRQVLVIFLFAAVLCGIFFGLGFIVGQSSKGGSAATTKQDSGTPGEKSANKKSAMSAPPAVEPAATPAGAADTPAVATAADGDGKSAAKPDAKQEADPPAAQPKPEEKGTPAPVAKAPAPVPAAVPAASAAADSGQFHLQVAAFSTHEEAEPMAALLKRKNFPVSIVAGTTDKLQHVMVGPYPNAKEADTVKKRLESEGFKPIVKK